MTTRRQTAAREFARAAAVEARLARYLTLDCGHTATREQVKLWPCEPGTVRCEVCVGREGYPCWPLRRIVGVRYPGVWPGPDDAPGY